MGLLILLSFAAALIVAVGTLALIYHLRHPRRKTFAVALARGRPTDPRELGLSAAEITFRFDDGSTSPGWVIHGDRSAGAGAGPTIVFTHGLADSRFGALRRVPLLTRFASRIVIYDLRGHGDSSAKVSDLTAREPDDLIAVMDQVDDGSPFVLMGHSMGAGISIVAAAKECSRLRLSSGGEKETKGKRQETGVRKQETENSEQNSPGKSQQEVAISDPRTPNPEPRTQNPEPRIVGIVAEAAYRFGMQPVAGYLWQRRILPQPFVWLAGLHFAFWLDLPNSRFDRVKHAAKLTCPLLLLHGTADDLCPLRAAEQIATAAPRGKLVTFDGGDHGNLAAHDERRYLVALTEFFREIGTPEASR